MRQLGMTANNRSGVLSSHLYLHIEQPDIESLVENVDVPIIDPGETESPVNQFAILEDSPGNPTSSGPLWSAIAEKEGVVETQNGETVSQPKRGRLERALGWTRRNKAVAAAGIIAVAGVITNPMGAGLDALELETARDVLFSMAAAEVGWISGAALALKAAGMDFPRTRNPLKFPGLIRDQFKNLSRESVTENRSLFNEGIALNTTAAVIQAGVPAAAIVANLPPSFWGLTSFCFLELWATFVIRRKILSSVK
jgi:hypothetical protein